MRYSGLLVVAFSLLSLATAQAQTLSNCRPAPPPSATLAFSHDKKLLAASSVGFDQKQTTYVYVQTVVWKVETGEKLWVIEGHKIDVNGLVFTRDDSLLLTGSVDRTIKFWDMKTGREARVISVALSQK
jgi:WD40 repeat protein